MNALPGPCTARHFSPISSRLRCHEVPRGASVPRRILMASCAAAAVLSPTAAAKARLRMVFTRFPLISEQMIGAGKQPARTALRHQIGEAQIARLRAVDLQRLPEQRLEF